ncbi:MAG: hydroxysqualene dehydroxylase [bacterium]
MSADILIVGGGPAGLACAGDLVQQETEYRVRIFEEKKHPGGRVSSYDVGEFPFLLDNCQHIITGGCRRSLKFFHQFAGEDVFSRQDGFAVAGRGEVDYINNCSLPVPFNLVNLYAALAGFTFTTLKSAAKLLGLKFANARRYSTAGSWLKLNQSSEVNQKFWNPLIKSVFNEKPGRLAFNPFKKWIFSGLLTSRRDMCVYIPRWNSREIFSNRIVNKLKKYGVEFNFNQPVERINPRKGEVKLKNGSKYSPDKIVSTVSPRRLHRLLADKVAGSPRFRALRDWDYSPILVVHLLVEDSFSFPRLTFLQDSFYEWIFHDPHRQDDGYLQLVKSAAYQYERMNSSTAVDKALLDLEDAFSVQFNINSSRVICEKRATVSLTPSVQRERFGPGTPCKDFYLAGDWTDTGWPASLESAVDSGYRAAEALVEG